MDSGLITTHTLYHHHVRELKKAREAIEQTDKYLNPESEHYLPTYISRLEEIQKSGKDVTIKIDTAKNNLKSYSERARKAQKTLDELPATLDELAESNQVFLTPPNRQHECLYILDEETCHASCMGWESDEEIGETTVLFSGKQDIELVAEAQTDAVRVWHDNVMINNLHITDHRTYNDAHRDAIQLIPPAQHKRINGQLRRIGDQLAGTIMHDVCIRSCKINAPNGPLQGIFASDGMHRNLRIINNDIATKGSHSISIAGLLTGGVISGNILRKITDSQSPEILLYPARIGGNMADDGVVTILSFAQEKGREVVDYGNVDTGSNANTLIGTDGKAEILKISDLRREIPSNIAHLSLGVENFHYHAYLDDFSGMTYADYVKKDPTGAIQLQAWLRLRYQEYTEGRSKGHALGQPSHEQHDIAKNNLAPALEALRQGSLNDEYISEISHTAIRSFIMKRLAIMHGDIVPLQDLGAKNKRRELVLRFLLA